MLCVKADDSPIRISSLGEDARGLRGIEHDDVNPSSEPSPAPPRAREPNKITCEPAGTERVMRAAISSMISAGVIAGSATAPVTGVAGAHQISSTRTGHVRILSRRGGLASIAGVWRHGMLGADHD